MFSAILRKTKIAILYFFTDRKVFWDRVRFYKQKMFHKKYNTREEKFVLIESRLGCIINTMKYKCAMTDDINDSLIKIENEMSKIAPSYGDAKRVYLINTTIKNIKTQGRF